MEYLRFAKLAEVWMDVMTDIVMHNESAKHLRHLLLGVAR